MDLKDESIHMILHISTENSGSVNFETISHLNNDILTFKVILYS